MTVESVENVSKIEAPAVASELTQDNTPQAEVKKTPSPAQDLRDIQMLLVQGIFPGQVAPAVVKAYHMLEQMALQIEGPKETK